jgi:bacterioferritin-associated ferredoxin
MYVCLCKGITDSQIRQAIAEGATSLRALRESLDVMTQCGKCGCFTRDLLNQTLSANSSDSGLFYSAA